MIEQLGIASLVFGGCCANVFALEGILKQLPDSGILITFVQFAFIALVSSTTQLFSSRESASQNRKRIPFKVWIQMAFLLVAVNLLNNWAFAFHISVPVHIILRSFGPAWAMLAKYVKHNKTYTKMQIVSVGILSVGILVSAWADGQLKSKSKNQNPSRSTTSTSDDTSASQTSNSLSPFLSGISILLLAQILAAYQGLYTEEIFSTYSASASDTLFFTHLFALPFFLPLKSTISSQYSALLSTPSIGTYKSFWSSYLIDLLPRDVVFRLADVSTGLINLAINAVTQLVCIAGVNLLASKSSAVTVTVVLNVRKLVSFVLSTLLFGHQLSLEMGIGAGLVFLGGALYGWESNRSSQKQKMNSKDKKES